ncbi:MAG: hypothetical protein QXM53_06555 [Thermofilaceae archaeon]
MFLVHRLRSLPSAWSDRFNLPVVTSANALHEAKDPLKGIKLQGNVEAEFIYATLLGGDIVPFVFTKLRPIVLPIEPILTGYRLLDVEDLRGRGFKDMANWLDKYQSLWVSKELKRSVSSRPDFNYTARLITSSRKPHSLLLSRALR